jgi:hypothetical protein
MKNRSFYNADGEMLFVPQTGRHRFVTELGVIDAEPQPNCSTTTTAAGRASSNTSIRASHEFNRRNA